MDDLKTELNFKREVWRNWSMEKTEILMVFISSHVAGLIKWGSKSQFDLFMFSQCHQLLEKMSYNFVQTVTLPRGWKQKTLIPQLCSASMRLTVLVLSEISTIGSLKFGTAIPGLEKINRTDLWSPDFSSFAANVGMSTCWTKMVNIVSITCLTH